MGINSRAIHQCQCCECEMGNVAIRQHHESLNLLMSRLEEQQRRWMAAIEASFVQLHFPQLGRKTAAFLEPDDSIDSRNGH